jgi:hypothetical protein
MFKGICLEHFRELVFKGIAHYGQKSASVSLSTSGHLAGDFWPPHLCAAVAFIQQVLLYRNACLWLARILHQLGHGSYGQLVLVLLMS